MGVHSRYAVPLGIITGTIFAACVGKLHEAPLAASIAIVWLLVIARSESKRALLHFARAAIRATLTAVVGIAVGFVVLAKSSDTPLSASLLGCLAACASAGFAIMTSHANRRRRALRIAVIGSDEVASALDAEIRASNTLGFHVVGYVPVAPERSRPSDASVPRLSGSYIGIVSRHSIDLLLLAPDVPRLSVFDELDLDTLVSHVRILELTQFYEDTFGHVPLTSINSSWLQYVMHPNFTKGVPPSKRAVDLLIAVSMSIALMPLLVILGAAIRLDGGPAFYSQLRIGEAGRSFRIYKFRSMRVDAGKVEAWSSSDDDRVTAVGRFMRRTHIDEVPQLFNVLRGDMSIVGPRPEQPHLAADLEREIPYYSRRHLARPGITGWAQVQCGYAGSLAGSRLKVCYDLYYVKRRSLILDLQILVETARTLFADNQWQRPASDKPFATSGTFAVVAHGQHPPTFVRSQR